MHLLMDETITAAVPLGEGGGCMDDESGVVRLGSLLSHIAAKLVVLRLLHYS